MRHLIVRHLIVRLRKALTTGVLAPVVPQDLEGYDPDQHQPADDYARDQVGPQGIGPHRGHTAIMSVDELLGLVDNREPMEKASRYWTDKGEERRGTAIAFGSTGATMVDHRTGYAERVEHGKYLHDDEDKPEPWAKMAQAHLKLGPSSGKALLALATLAVEQGVEEPWTVRPSVSGNRVSIGKAKIDDATAAATARAMVARAKTDRDLWTWREGGRKQKLTGAALNAYRARIGALPDAERAEPSKDKTQLSRPPRPPVTPGRAAGPGGSRLLSPRTFMRKAELARELPQLTSSAAGIPVRTWTLRGYQLDLRRRGVFAILTVMHKAFALPYHLLVKSEADAVTKAQRTIEAFEAGRTPDEGIFRALEA